MPFIKEIGLTEKEELACSQLLGKVIYLSNRRENYYYLRFKKGKKSDTGKNVKKNLDIATSDQEKYLLMPYKFNFDKIHDLLSDSVREKIIKISILNAKSELMNEKIENSKEMLSIGIIAISLVKFIASSDKLDLFFLSVCALWLTALVYNEKLILDQIKISRKIYRVLGIPDKSELEKGRKLLEKLSLVAEFIKGMENTRSKKFVIEGARDLIRKALDNKEKPEF